MSQRCRGVAIARRLLSQRRVTVPAEMGHRAQLAKGLEVAWSRAGDSRTSLIVRPYSGDPEVRDLVRKINSVWQVVIPPPLTRTVGLKVGDWVYLTLGSDARSIRLTPAQHLRMNRPRGSRP